MPKVKSSKRAHFSIAEEENTHDKRTKLINFSLNNCFVFTTKYTLFFLVLREKGDQLL